MNIFEVAKKENIGKSYEIFIDGESKGIWELKETNRPKELEFYKDRLILTEVYFSSQLIRTEFKETVDWSKVPVDTLVEVSDDGENFIKRYFAKYESGLIFVWGDGRSSKTAYGKNDVVRWKIANIIRG